MQDIRRMMILAYPDSSSDLGKIMAKDCFLDAIFDKSLSLKVREHSPADLDAAFQLAVKFEAYAQLSSPQKGEDKSKGSKVQTVVSHIQDDAPPGGKSWNAFMESQNDLFKQLESQGEQIMMLSKQVQNLSSPSVQQSKEQVNNSPSPKKTIKCFGCGEVDHILPKCPYRRNNRNKTESADRPGHSMGPKADSAGVSTISGALFIHANINGRRCSCLVDTGFRGKHHK